MQIGANTSAYALKLFGVQNGATSQVPNLLSSAKPSVTSGGPTSLPMQGVYADPNAMFAPSKISGVPKDPLDAFKTYQDTEMRTTQDALKADIEKTSGRSLNETERFSQLTKQLSNEERSSRSHDTRVSLQTSRADESRLESIFRAVNKQGWDAPQNEKSATMSVEE